QLLDSGCDDSRQISEFLGNCRLPRAVDQTKSVSQLTQDRERLVRANRKLKYEPLLMAVFGQGRDSKPHRMPRRTRLDDASVHSDLPAIGPRDAEEHLADFGAARAHEAEEAEDLARSDLEADVLDKASTGESSYTEDREADLRIFLGEEGPGFGADHVTNGLLRSQIGGGRCDDALAGAQDGNLIPYPEDLINEVTDEKNGHPLFFEPCNDLE